MPVMFFLRKSFQILVCTSIISMTNSAQAQISPIDPTTSWANTFLLNSVFAADYAAFMKASKLDDQERREHLVSEDATNTFVRSKFALMSAQQKKQTITDSEAIETFQMGHASYLTSILKVDDQRKSILFASQQPKEFPAIVGSTFKNKSFKSYWQHFADSYKQQSPSCPISLNEISSFAKHQKTLMGDNASVNAKTLTAPIRPWNLTKTRCLVLAMMATSNGQKSSQGLEPIHLLSALVQTNSPFAKDSVIRAMHAIRLLQLNRYPETLRILVDLQDAEESYRLPYEIVQRIYSRIQKGQGQVALKGI